MKVIGITGQAGSGKSVVLDMLEKEFNGYVIIADDVSRRQMEPGHASFIRTLEHFGPSILTADGKIDRFKLAEIVFSNKKELEFLNSFTHQYVEEEIKNTISMVKELGTYSAIFVEFAVITKSDFTDIFDQIWYVCTNEETRRQRMKENRGYSDEKIDNIIQNQKKSEEFADLCDFTIENNGDLEELRENLKKIFVKIDDLT
ncbi:MAG: dephospho-CoA kinase [Lachnospiraceae bacterium]|nr:dephospho-CoA kinase [Lachnospiraceae bacterium]